MGGDVRGAVEVWEAEQALEGMEDEEMEFDDDIEEITSVYVQPCDENDDEEEVVCTGERKAEEHVMSKKSAVVCCPFEFEGPTTCTELDVEMDMECDVEIEMEMEMDLEQGAVHHTNAHVHAHKFTNTPAAQGRAWSEVFQVEDDDDERHC